MAKITIDGKACECDEGEYILQVARRCGVFIPALCYLSGSTPTLACRLCMVEADGKRVYSCNAKAKDGMVIYSRSPEIDAEREAITQVYCINHPMACGVCDQSGECELQNLAHLMRTNTQSYAIRDTAREVQDWGYLSYDPSLCIVCERCITAAKDRLGVDAFKLVPRGGDAPSKEQKDAMPKDAYAVWNKLQKSLIARVNENDDCVNYGESAAVCPTGALVESAFKYVSNAWELRQIPASNPHSSDCELLYYEVKRRGIGDPREKIYRVSSDINFSVLHAGARFGWDFSNERASKNEAVFSRIVRGIEDGEIKNIKFNSFITNEEARILELLRQKFKLALINDEALAYQKFLREFSKLSGTKFYNADSQTIKNSDFIVVCGTFLRSDAPNLGYAVNSACKMNKAGGVYFHLFCDEGIKSF
ncbi:MAG: NADH-quinone oxidoreductase subunit G, partial [Campylobacter sp.]